MGTKQFEAWFSARQPDHTILKVEVTAQTNSGQLTHIDLNDETAIQFYEYLHLFHPYSTTGDA